MGERLFELVSGFSGIPRLVGVNLICFLAFLPVITWFYLAFNTYINAGPGGDMIDFLPGIGYFAGLLLQLPPLVFYGLFFVSAACIGPFTLGLHYMAGAAVRKVDVPFSDFFKQSVQHVRRLVFLGLFAVVAVHFLLWNLFFTLTGALPWLNFALAASRWVSIGLLVFFFLLAPFVCQMLVSTRLSLWAVMKNAVILARIYLGRGLLAFVFILAYWWLTVAMLPLAGLAALPLFSFSLTALVQAGVCWPVLEKHVVEPEE